MTDYLLPNFYSFATKELDQDAVLAYILAWADPKYQNAPAPDSKMHALAQALLGALVSTHPNHEDWTPEKVTTVEVTTQEKHVDVRALIETEDGTLILIVEDKIGATEHSNQIRRYVEDAGRRFPEAEIVPVYVKTGNESGDYLRRRLSMACGVFPRKALLGVLNDHRGTGNRIVDDFRDHWQGFDDQTEEWRVRKVAGWGWRQIEGCYLELERHEAEWHWGVDTRGFKQVLNFWADFLMMATETMPEIQLRVEIENAKTMWISAHHKDNRPVSRTTLEYLKTVLASRKGLSVGMGLTLRRAHTKAGSRWPRPVQVIADEKTLDYRALNEDDTIDVDETVKRIRRVGDFIRKTPQRVARRDALSRLVRERLERSQSGSPWMVRPPSERLRLYKENHWSETAFSGVWFLWDADDQTFRVGIEWPRDGVTNLADRVQECFREAGVPVSREQVGGRERKRVRTRWFFGSLRAEDWSWERLCDKSDEELNDYADAVVALMRALAGVIDDAEEIAASQTAP